MDNNESLDMITRGNQPDLMFDVTTYKAAKEVPSTSNSIRFLFITFYSTWFLSSVFGLYMIFYSLLFLTSDHCFLLILNYSSFVLSVLFSISSWRNAFHLAFFHSALISVLLFVLLYFKFNYVLTVSDIYFVRDKALSFMQYCKTPF